MKEWIKKHRVIIEGCIILSGLVLLFFYSYYPLSCKAFGLQNQVKKAEEKGFNEDNKSVSYKEIQNKIRIVNEKFGILKEKIPAEQNVPQVIQTLNQLVERFSLEVVSMKFMPEISKDIYKEKPIEITIQGRYQDMASFMTDIEGNFPWFLNINQFQIRGINNEPNQQAKMVLQSTLNIVIYVLK